MLSRAFSVAFGLFLFFAFGIGMLLFSLAVLLHSL